MPKFPVDASLADVIRTLKKLGFRMVREGNHIAMIRDNADGTSTPLTIPNHRNIKSSTLHVILNQSKIQRDDFLAAYYD